MICVIARLAAVVMLCAQLAACQAVADDEQISVEALAVQIAQGNAPLVLDVQSFPKYAEGHIPGAVNIDYRDIPNQLETIRAFNSTKVVVYCERGIRADIADTLLTDAGFTSVFQLTGSMSAWRKADLPIVAGEEVGE